MTKKTTAVLWTDGKNHTITLNEPVIVLNLKDGTSKGSDDIKVIDAKVPLPTPMTSNQYNNFINTDDGRAWAKEIFGVYGIKVGW